MRLFFLIPIFYFVPLATKSGENIQQIASISAYIRVFHDYCSLYGEDEIFNWETSNNVCSNVNVDRGDESKDMYVYNSEYIILAVSSLLLYILIAGHFSLSIVQKYSCAIVWTYIVLVAVLGITAFFATGRIYRVSSMRKAMMKNTEKYITAYTNRAQALGWLSKAEVAAAQKELMKPAKKSPMNPTKKE